MLLLQIQNERKAFNLPLMHYWMEYKRCDLPHSSHIHLLLYVTYMYYLVKRGKKRGRQYLSERPDKLNFLARFGIGANILLWGVGYCNTRNAITDFTLKGQPSGFEKNTCGVSFAHLLSEFGLDCWQ